MRASSERRKRTAMLVCSQFTAFQGTSHAPCIIGERHLPQLLGAARPGGHTAATRACGNGAHCRSSRQRGRRKACQAHDLPQGSEEAQADRRREDRVHQKLHRRTATGDLREPHFAPGPALASKFSGRRNRNGQPHAIGTGVAQLQEERPSSRQVIFHDLMR